MLPSSYSSAFRRLSRLVLVLAVSSSTRTVETPKDRASVFLLVDKSGTMRRDPEGWRKEAAKLLAYSLTNGSTFAVAGFGDPDKPVELKSLLLDDTVQGTENRQTLAARIDSLGDADQKTDIYGAIRTALTKIAAMDPDTRAAKPPYIVMLSDFEPDPDPGDEARKSICDDLKQTGAHMLAVGFGRVHRPTIEFLRSCGDTTVWGPVVDSSSLMEVFWKIQHRVSRALPIEQRALQAGERVNLGFPSWAQQGFVLASTRNRGAAAPFWKGVIQGAAQVTGKSFRLARWTSGVGTLIDFTCTEPAELSVVAAGPIELQASFDPPMPWLVNEPVSVSAKLVSPATGAVVTEWLSAAVADTAARWKIESDITPLTLNPNTSAAEGIAPAPATETSGSGVATISVSGAYWSRSYRTHVVSSPFLVGSSYSTRRLFKWQRLSVPLESALGDRDFTATVRPPAGFMAIPQTVSFGRFSRSQFILLQAYGAPASFFARVLGGLAAAVEHVPEKTIADLASRLGLRTD
jgi:hypothetical protein